MAASKRKRKSPRKTAAKRKTRRAVVSEVEESCGLAEGDYAPDTDALTRSVAGPSADGAGALDDAVQVEVRPDEVVIRIRTTAFQAGAEPSARPLERAARGIEMVRAADVVRAAGALRAPTAKPPVQLKEVPADKLGDGYRNFWLRGDLVDEYMGVLRKVRALGGIVTSSGAIRDLGAGVTPGRSRTSFHYTGRAIDLYIYTGMQGASDRYLVQRRGGTDANPEWEVLCVSQNPVLTDPAFDANLLKTGEVEYLVWKKGKGNLKQKRTATYFSLTSLLREFGWVNIPARSDWVTNYLSVEWWHFQHHKGLIDGVSKFGDDLRDIYSAERVAASGLAVNAIFSGRSFRA